MSMEKMIEDIKQMRANEGVVESLLPLTWIELADFNLNDDQFIDENIVKVIYRSR